MISIVAAVIPTGSVASASWPHIQCFGSICPVFWAVGRVPGRKPQVQTVAKRGPHWPLLFLLFQAAHCRSEKPLSGYQDD
jgi:hypothetical protein